jgi:hypothetical protein
MDSAAYILLVAEWHDFFIVSGTAAATLVGLLFVGLSLNVDEVMAPDRPDLRALAEQAFSSFTYVLLISLFFLVPAVDSLTIGLELATLGVLGLLRVLIRLARGLGHGSQPRWGFAWMARRLGWPALAYVGLLFVALGLAQLQPDAMSILVAVLFVLLTSAADSAWDLLVKVSEDKRRRAAELALITMRTAANNTAMALAGSAAVVAAVPDSGQAMPAPAQMGSRPASDADRSPSHDVEAAAEPEVVGRTDEIDPDGG